jgi:hypothetical protein
MVLTWIASPAHRVCSPDLGQGVSANARFRASKPELAIKVRVEKSALI